MGISIVARSGSVAGFDVKVGMIFEQRPLFLSFVAYLNGENNFLTFVRSFYFSMQKSVQGLTFFLPIPQSKSECSLFLLQ